MTVATYLTLSRLVIAPIFLIFYIFYASMGIPFIAVPFILLGLLIVSELTDLLDGWAARRLNQVTDLGKLLDPMADSITRISIFLTLTRDPVGLPMLLVLVFIYRDMIIGTLRTICGLRGFALAARPSGKVKAVVQAVATFAIVVLLIPYALGAISQDTLWLTSTWIVAAAALYTVISGVDYLYSNRDHIMRLLKPAEG